MGDSKPQEIYTSFIYSINISERSALNGKYSSGTVRQTRERFVCDIMTM